MDELVVDKKFLSRVATLIAATRAPYIACTDVNKHPRINPPYVMTRRGVIFGIPAVVDYLVSRLPDPPLADSDPGIRGLQLTVFYALTSREHQRLALADAAESASWLRDLRDAVRGGGFYAGEQFSIVDCAIMVLTELIHERHGIYDETVRGYVARCSAIIDAITARNRDTDEDDN